jgi:ssDNA-binding Zn-finger/Zn-ribbon topoisomerase 1
MSHTTICPKCNAKTEVSESLVGRFVTCDNCHCLYYVVVPPLKKEGDENLVSVPAVSTALPTTPPSLRQSFETRYTRIFLLLAANLVIGAAILIIELIRLYK